MDAKSVTVREAIHRAGESIATTKGITPAAAVQSVYELTLDELVDAVRPLPVAGEPLVDPAKEKEADRIAKARGFKAPDAPV